MNGDHSVLLIEDNPGDVRLIQEMLAEEPVAPFRLICADRLSRGLEFLAAEDADLVLVLLDLSLPDSYGLDTFARVYAHFPSVPIIVLTDNDDRTVALAAVKGGAQDYLLKGRLDRELLVRTMHYSIERKHYQDQLERQANYDVLTGLPNRNLFHDRLSQAVYAQRHRRPLALVFIDLDHFKFVNDSLGHHAGDELLKVVADRLRSCVREADTVARLGGDEFVLILNDQTNEELIFHAMQRIISRLVEPISINERELYITCSAGISLYPQDGPDVETLLKNADAAMYRAKEQGRNNFQFFTAEMNARANERLALENGLRRAVECDEFILHYQPRVDLKTRSIVGVEALIRWQHPRWGLLPPERFIPLAEETGLIVSIGDWVLRTAFAQSKSWQDAGMPRLTMSVNLSARQFKQKDLVKSVARALQATRLDGRCVELELTESLVMHNPEGAIATLLELKSLGLRLAVDDFGTGYSSLSYLKRFPLDALKIDQSFVRDIGSDPDDAVLTRAIISLGHSLNMKTVAEGVETAEQLTLLEEQGCDEVQGFFLGEPLPPDEFQRVFLNRRTVGYSSRVVPENT